MIFSFYPRGSLSPDFFGNVVTNPAEKAIRRVKT